LAIAALREQDVVDPAAVFSALALVVLAIDTPSEQAPRPARLPARRDRSTITADRFHWQGHSATDGGQTWRLLEEMHARRHPDAQH
jgi:hypothetical protein